MNDDFYDKNFIKNTIWIPDMVIFRMKTSSDVVIADVELVVSKFSYSLDEAIDSIVAISLPIVEDIWVNVACFVVSIEFDIVVRFSVRDSVRNSKNGKSKIVSIKN